MSSGCSIAGDSGRWHEQAIGRGALALAQLKLELDQLAIRLGEADARV
jgi:hypothetical protein